MKDARNKNYECEIDKWKNGNNNTNNNKVRAKIGLKNVVDVAIKIALQANISNCLANLSAYFLTAVPHILNLLCCFLIIVASTSKSRLFSSRYTHFSYNHNHTHNC